MVHISEVADPWSRGYDVALTRRRSLVQIRPGPPFSRFPIRSFCVKTAPVVPHQLILYTLQGMVGLCIHGGSGPVFHPPFRDPPVAWVQFSPLDGRGTFTSPRPVHMSQVFYTPSSCGGSRTRGLGVMTSPSHGGGRRFKSGRVHHSILTPPSYYNHGRHTPSR